MSTLNSIAENIAFKLGGQFNNTLKESIKETVLDYRAKFIRDDLAKNAASDMHIMQTGAVMFKKVNLLSEFTTDYGYVTAICPEILEQERYEILRSIEPLPVPIRKKNSTQSGFYFLGRIDGSKRFVLTTLDKFPYYKSLRYNEHTIYYIILNQYVYIINNLDKCDINLSLKIINLMVKDAFEDPREFYNACDNGDTFIDDMPFPMGRDMVLQISNGILKGEYPLKAKDGEQVNINPDGNE